MNKIWIGIRSCGRPQLISVLTSIYNNIDMFDGITIVGSVDRVSSNMFGELGLKLHHLVGSYDLGKATVKMVDDIVKVDSSLILFIDDDVLFNRKHLEDLLIKKAEGFQVVSVMQRGPYISGNWESIWMEEGNIELYFSLFDKSVLSKFTMDDLDLLERCKYGGEFFCLTWILRRYGIKMILGCEKDRPYHLFVCDDKSSSWRLADLNEWDELGDKIKEAKNIDKVKSIIDEWNELIRKKKK